MNKILFSILVLANSLFANNLTIYNGWNLVGSSIKIDLNRTFSEYQDISLIWGFDNQKKDWVVFRNTNINSQNILDNVYDKLSNIEQHQGVWILNNGRDLNIELLRFNEKNIVTGEITDLNFKKCISSELGESSNHNPTKDELETITYLSCDNKSISSISGIGNLSSLTSLYLGHNNIKDIPSEIGNLTNLTTLYLSINNITDIPPEIGNLSSLTSLYLPENQIIEIPSEIGKLTNLTGLYLSDNKIRKLPSEIINLTNLTGLYLSDNQITEIQYEIGKLTSLTSLSLDNNQITEIPSEIGNLTNLTSLDLIDNHIKEIPSSLNSLTNLTSTYSGSPFIMVNRKDNETIVAFLERALGL